MPPPFSSGLAWPCLECCPIEYLGMVLLLLRYLALGPGSGSSSSSASCGGGNAWRAPGSAARIGGDLPWSLLRSSSP